MNIEIQRASNLGDLHRKLNIDADSRISLRELDRDGIQIWDLSTGNYLVINPLVSPMTVEQFHVEVPLWAVEIIEMPSDQLLAKWKEGWHENDIDKRMVIHTELVFRGLPLL